MSKRLHIDRFVSQIATSCKVAGEGALMPSAVSLVHDLLTYIEHVEKLKTKPAFTVPTEYFIAYQHELKGLPELQFNLQNENEDIWLRVPRLQEVAAPGLDDRLAAWVVLSK